MQNLKKTTPFLGRFAEIQITYDFDTLSVEADGLLPGGFWENILVQYDVNDPQTYAFGVYDTLTRLYKNIHISVIPFKHIEEEGFHQCEGDDC